MWQYLIKIIVTAVLVVLISEAAKRWTLLGAIIASLPLTSILAMVWLYLDTKNVEKVATLSWGIFWVVIPSLAFFVLSAIGNGQLWVAELQCMGDRWQTGSRAVWPSLSLNTCKILQERFYLWC